MNVVDRYWFGSATGCYPPAWDGDPGDGDDSELSASFTTHSDAWLYVAYAIESAGRDIARRDDFDVDGIVGVVFTFDGQLYRCEADTDTFWGVVRDHAR